MTSRYQNILEILNPCLKNKGLSLWESFFRYYFFDKINAILNVIFSVSMVLAIIFRLIFGSVLENTKNETIDNPDIVIFPLVFLVFLSLAMLLIIFVRALFYSAKELQNRKAVVGRSRASTILGSILYKFYTLQESDFLGGIIREHDKYKILENLASHDIQELKFAENHFSHLESIAKKYEDYNLRVFTAGLGALTVALFSLFSEDGIGDKLLQGLTFAFAITLLNYFYSRDSYASRLRFCVHLLKQAQILRTGTLENWVRERETFDPGQMDHL